MSLEFSTDLPPRNFVERLRERETQAASGEHCLPSTPDVKQWLQYWNDEESLAGNVRNFEHWLQRARPRA